MTGWPCHEAAYYYKPSGERRGVKPSTDTLKADGTLMANAEVVDKIKTILSGEFVCYGYKKITMQLKQNDFIINHKKVYRLMDENSLLLGKSMQGQGDGGSAFTQKCFTIWLSLRNNFNPF